VFLNSHVFWEVSLSRERSFRRFEVSWCLHLPPGFPMKDVVPRDMTQGSSRLLKWGLNCVWWYQKHFLVRCNPTYANGRFGGTSNFHLLAWLMEAARSTATGANLPTSYVWLQTVKLFSIIYTLAKHTVGRWGKARIAVRKQLRTNDRWKLRGKDTSERQAAGRLLFLVCLKRSANLIFFCLWTARVYQRGYLTNNRTSPYFFLIIYQYQTDPQSMNKEF